jgi:glycosyltransferase involved in cell wall biosynthesis
MRLALASNYPPDRRPLSEYAFHLVDGLRSSAGSTNELVVLSGKYPGPALPDVRRVWHDGSAQIPFQIVRAVRQTKADALLFNTLFTSWGSNVANLAGLLTPLVARHFGINVVSLVHHLPQTINAQLVGYRLTPLHRLAVELGCRALAASNVVCFTLKRDLDLFTRRYQPRQTLRVPHGLQGEARWRPTFGNGTVLTFGKWGRAKDPRPVIKAFLECEALTGELLVAGISSHTRPGFYEQLRQTYAADRVKFTGYVDEPSVPGMFHSADLVVLPYVENTGVSGVLYQTSMYGRVPLLKRLPVFEDMVEELGLVAHFYDDDAELAHRMCALIQDPAHLASGGRHNFEAVRALSMDRVGQIYWRLLDAHA